ncbi:CBU_0585 family protein [Candidatus Berkiella aquae]|uniref:Uncharacterized protein n=1 Tax=Candidatus Berkiella aquae TaxID=295108 RepID=A0A0Q9YPZ6_9GAMM|nr:CBU_0585 family protein [Candidatus Berkiella aquae]MCS5711756.1 hypothetical protein [Candidatus Berkiella aquae]
MTDKAIKSIQRTGYVSEIDQFLRDHDKNRQSFGESRKKEVEKHQRIFAKRDNVVEEEASPIWEKF